MVICLSSELENGTPSLDPQVSDSRPGVPEAVLCAGKHATVKAHFLPTLGSEA